MEEKDKKSLTIGDILDQLIRPSAIQVPGAPPPRPIQAGSPPSISPSPPQKTETSSEIRLPSLGKETGSSAFTSPSSALQQSELKLSIRTMSADLTRLKQGQRPLGQEIRKPIGQEIKRPIPPVPQPKPRIEPSISPRPQVIPQIPQTPKPRPAAIPAPQRSAYRPAPPTAPSTSLPSSTTAEPGHYHKERIISQDMLPPFLGAPVPRKKPIKPPDEKVEYGLIARVIGSGMTTGIVSTVAVAVAIFLLLRFFVFNQGGPTVSTPTPTQIEPTPVTEINELETIFRTVSAANFAIPEDKQQTLTLLESFKTNQILAKKEFRRINFISPLGQANQSLNFSDILNSLSIPFPAEFKDNIKDNYMVFIYGQEELFNQKEIISPSTAQRMVMIVEVKDIEKSKELLGRWESTMAKDFENIFGLDMSQQASQTFLDNERRGVTIHYKNFPLPDRSLDYAIITSPAGRGYLVITNSRESMYSPADKIQGL